MAWATEIDPVACYAHRSLSWVMLQQPDASATAA
ncbi:UNVERIFIED_ORG: hypothetical protein GGR78_000779 [Xanthomonas campestris]